MNNVSVSDKKSPVRNAILGFQHLLAMYSGDILVPLLIGAALKFNAVQ
ncbi:purine permease, partial [Lactobacillus delbrueckii subsp. bulgaricus]